MLDLEDIVSLDKYLVKNALRGIDTLELVKAVCIVSPAVKNYFQDMYHDIDFTEIRKAIGSIPIEEALEKNRHIVELINTNY